MIGEKSQIDFIEKAFKKNGLKIISTPEKYKMADSLMYDGPYHLNKTGVERRTSLLIEDLKTVINTDSRFK